MQQLERLHRAIIDGNPEPVLPDLRPHPRLSPRQQMAIYVHGYRERLTNAVLGDYPCLAHYLGEQAMKALAKSYAETVPSRSYNLDFYPFGFCCFVREHVADPAAGDLADFESAIAEVFMLPESTPLTIESFRNFDIEALGAMALPLRKEARLLSCNHHVETYWQNFKDGTAAADIPAKPCHLIIYRPQHDVLRHRLDPIEFALLQCLSDNQNLAAAIDHVIAQSGVAVGSLALSLAGWLPRWIGAGYFRVP